MAGILTEVFATDIAENLFPNNSFVVRSNDDSMWVSNKTVNRAQAGAAPTVEINRTSLPATISPRTDTNLSYDIDELTSSPTLITDIDEIETAYLKRQSVLFNHVEEINTKAAALLANKWAATTAAAIVRTTGTNRPATLPSATGTRKKLLKIDLLNASRILDRMDVPSAGRIALLTSEMYNDLLEDLNLLSSDFMGQANLSAGVVRVVYGFEIYIRSSVNVFTDAATPVLKAVGAAGAATDNAGALIYGQSFVHRAKGDVKVYYDEDKPEFYGSVFSAMARIGGKPRYTNLRGIVSIVEAAGA